jgi:SsrA-binding protein
MAKGKQKKNDGGSTIALNKKAGHEYFIEQRIEAGLVLEGWEVKSLRAGRIQLKEGYVKILHGEAFLIGAHISALAAASTHVNPDPTRSRKLLLKRSEISRLIGQTERAGYTLVPDGHVLEARPRQARDRARQGQEAARQARHREGPRLAARQGTPLQDRLSLPRNPGYSRVSH